MSEPTQWRWVYHPPADRESGRLDWTSTAGEVAATVFTGRDGIHHNWYVWNMQGVGGENSSSLTIDTAIVEAEHAARRWGLFDFPPLESPP